MRLTQYKIAKYKFFLVTLSAFVIINLLGFVSAFGQVDFNYDRNTSGVRLSVGGGVTTLMTHYNKNPIQGTFLGSLDYDITPYLSFGFEAQAGKLKGVDDLHHLYYASSTDNYLAATFNVRVAVGQFYDFAANNAWQDAVKRIYIGAGFGRMHTDNTFTYNQDLRFTAYGGTYFADNLYVFPFNLGTDIDLPGILGVDKLSINPNYQFNYVNSLYLDGFQSSQYSHLKGFYSVISVKLKYKF